MLVSDPKRGTPSSENSELCGFASLGTGKHFSVKGQILNILGFEGLVVPVQDPEGHCYQLKAVINNM